MTELTPERQSHDPMDVDSDAGDIPPNSKPRRTRRRRWYLVAVTFALLLTVPASGLFRYGTCTAAGSYPSSGITFDLTALLADATTPVHFQACVRQRYSTLRLAKPKPTSTCASFAVDQRGSRFTVHGQWSDPDLNLWYLPDAFVKEPSLSSGPIAVRLIASQAGHPIFVSSALVRQLYKSQPNGPHCPPTHYVGTVVATGTGRLVPQT